MNKIKFFLLCFIGLISCQTNYTVEVWKTEFIQMKSETSNLTDNLTDHSQYLYLYENGEALLLDSLIDGTIQRTKTTWKIEPQKGKEIFFFGYGRESEGLLGLAYPIVKKNDHEFQMVFDCCGEHHVWNLKRVEGE